MYVLVALFNHQYAYVYVEFCKTPEDVAEAYRRIDEKLNDSNDEADIRVELSKDENGPKTYTDLIKKRKVLTTDKQVTLDKLCDLSWDY